MKHTSKWLSTTHSICLFNYMLLVNFKLHNGISYLQSPFWIICRFLYSALKLKQRDKVVHCKKGAIAAWKLSERQAWGWDGTNSWRTIVTEKWSFYKLIFVCNLNAPKRNVILTSSKNLTALNKQNKVILAQWIIGYNDERKKKRLCIFSFIPYANLPKNVTLRSLKLCYCKKLNNHVIVM